jgi:hypothetical protein
MVSSKFTKKFHANPRSLEHTVRLYLTDNVMNRDTHTQFVLASFLLRRGTFIFRCAKELPYGKEGKFEQARTKIHTLVTWQRGFDVSELKRKWLSEYQLHVTIHNIRV